MAQKFSTEQRIFICRNFIKNESAAQCRREFQESFPGVIPPNRRTVHKIVNKFKTTGSVLDKKKNRRPHVLTEEKLDDIGAQLERSPQKSLSQLAQHTGISYGSAQRATKLLKSRPYKSQRKVCKIDEDVKEALKKLHLHKNEKNAALIMKVDREKKKICIDELLEDVKVDELRESLRGHQPRFVIYSYKMEHSDGQISYPICFIYITPRDSQTELQIMCAGTKLALQKEADITHVYEVQELNELTEEWLNEKLSK